MKKIVSVFFALIFVLSCFSACGGKKKEDPTRKSTESAITESFPAASATEEISASEINSTEESTSQQSEKETSLSTGEKTPETIADAFFKAIYQDMDAEAAFALTYAPIVEALAKEEGMTAAELKDAVLSELNASLDEYQADLSAYGIDCRDLTYVLTTEAVDDYEIADLNVQLSSAGYRGESFTEALFIVISILNPAGEEISDDEILVGKTNGEWFFLASEELFDF